MAQFDKTLYDFVPATGVVWGKDGSGPYIMDATGTPRIVGWMTSQIAGELSQFNTTAAGGVLTAVSLPATTVALSGGPWIFYGVVAETAGTLGSLYDNNAASGKLLAFAKVLAQGEVYMPYGGAGRLTDSTSMFPTYATGTYSVLVRAAVA